MAANLQQMKGSFTGIIKGLNKIWGNIRDPTNKASCLQNTVIPAQALSRKYVHSSLYEKDQDDGVQLNRVPEEFIQTETQKSWIPHPKTGVFGPAEEHNWAGGDNHHSDEKRGESVLEQQAWFRPLEDVQKQPSN